jgi:hypothetical protein
MNKVEKSAGDVLHSCLLPAELVAFFASPGWEIVQLAVHQILDLIILVRVQVSQPTSSVDGV